MFDISSDTNFVDSVACESLKRVLSSGVFAKMEKAMIMLVKKSAAGALDQAKVGTSHPNHSVSIELRNNNGEMEIISVGKQGDSGDENELGPRKQLHSHVDRAPEVSPRGVDGGSGSGVNKTLTIVGNQGILTPTVAARAHKEIVSVEVRPNERWIGGSTVPLPIFLLFNLPWDVNAYIERS